MQHDGTFASLRVVTIAEGLDLVSLTQILAWDLPLDAKLRAAVAEHAAQHAAGHGVAGDKSGHKEVRPGEAQLQEGRGCAAALQLSGRGLTDEALRTLILMVLATGADVRRALV